MSIDSAGNVGVGTTPVATGLSAIYNYPGKNVITIENSSSTGFSSMDFWNNTGALSTTFGFANSGTGGIFSSRAYMNSYGNDFVLTQNSGSYNIFIKGSNGNVGINTSTPQNTFDVSGAVAIGTYGGVNTAPTNGLLVSGDLEVGTTGDYGVISAQASGGQEVLLGGGSTTGSEIKFQNFGQAHFSIYNNGTVNSNGANYLTFANTSTSAYDNVAGTSLMVIDENGQVGIGTTSPSYPLDVTGTGRLTGKLTIGAITLPNTDGSANQVLSTNGSGTVSWTTPAAAGWGLTGNSISATGNFLGTTSNNSLRIRTNNVERLTVDSTGKVGIGTPTPTATLSVAGTTILGTNGTALNAIVKGTGTTTSLAIAANTTSTQTYTLTNATTTGSVIVSPNGPLAAGLVIAYSYVSSANTITVAYRNTTAASVTLAASTTLYITVIQ